MIKKRVEKLNIVDLEATCQDSKITKDFPMEIIQIGVVPINLETRTIQKSKGISIIVKPVSAEITEYCSSLTGITEQTIRSKGVDRVTALNTLQKHVSKTNPWGSWGLFDPKLLKRTAAESGVEMPFSDDYYNLKNMFSLLNGIKKELGLLRALEYLQLSFQGRQHDALTDAFNTAIVIAESFWGKGYKIE